MNIENLLSERQIGLHPSSSNKFTKNTSLVRRLALTKVWKGHTGCVNCLCWDVKGEKLLSGSDDTRLCLWKVSDSNRPILRYTTGHRANIFSCKFFDHVDNSLIASCAGDGETRVFNLERQGPLNVFKCTSHDRVKRLSLFPPSSSQGPSSFLACDEGGGVRLYDLRKSHSCREHGPCENSITSVYQTSRIQLHTISINHLYPHLFLVGGGSSYAYIHDMRKPESPLAKYEPDSEMDIDHVTALKWCADGTNFIGNWSGDAVYMFSTNFPTYFDKPTQDSKKRLHSPPHSPAKRIRNQERAQSNMPLSQEYVGSSDSDSSWSDYDSPPRTMSETLVKCPTSSEHVAKYSGAMNVETIKDVTIMGDYVAAGSDDGSIFIWPAFPSIYDDDLEWEPCPVQILYADNDVVNVIESRPGFGPISFASSGIDDTVKFWEPFWPTPSRILDKMAKGYRKLERNPNWSTLHDTDLDDETPRKASLLEPIPTGVDLMASGSKIYSWSLMNKAGKVIRNNLASQVRNVEETRISMALLDRLYRNVREGREGEDAGCPIS